MLLLEKCWVAEGFHLLWFGFESVAGWLLPVTSSITHQASSAGLSPFKTWLLQNAWVFFLKSNVFRGETNNFSLLCFYFLTFNSYSL